MSRISKLSTGLIVSLTNDGQSGCDRGISLRTFVTYVVRKHALIDTSDYL